MTTKTYPNGLPSSLGEAFIRSKAFREFPERPEVHLSIDTKALFETGAGWEPDTQRTSRAQVLPERALSVSNLPTLEETGEDSVDFMLETLATKAAQETAEGGLYQEAAFAVSEQLNLIRKIGVWIPVTEEVFDDAPRARDYVNSRLTRAINERVDGQILNGSGVAPNIAGLLTNAGINTQALGTDTRIAAIRKAITLVRTQGQLEPDAVVMNPTDWEELQLEEGGTTGLYVAGFPGLEGSSGSIWGLPVIPSLAATAGTALVGAFRAASSLVLKGGIDVQVTDSHATDFINGRLSVRADVRVTLVVYRPSAFTQVTGI
jgi:HK97 family phage major capsid protein